METTLYDRCLRLVMEARLFEGAEEPEVTAWDDGSFSVAIRLLAGEWCLRVHPEAGWVRVTIPLVELSEETQLSSRLTTALRRNHSVLAVTRFALQGRTLALRADYPVDEFHDDEFRDLIRRCWNGTRNAVMDLGLRAERGG